VRDDELIDRKGVVRHVSNWTSVSIANWLGKELLLASA
jgi:hypothetical protein